MINFSCKSSTLHESHESLKSMEQDLLQRSNKAEVTIRELKYWVIFFPFKSSQSFTEWHSLGEC